jgi:hypothetical protein
MSRVSRNQLSSLDDPVFTSRPSGHDSHFVRGWQPFLYKIREELPVTRAELSRTAASGCVIDRIC